MSKYTKQDIIQMVEDEDVEFIRLQFTDMFGTLKNVAVTSSQLEKALNNECMFDGSSIEGFVRIEESDMYLYPDLDTFCIFPWRPQQGKVARIICDIYTADKQPFSGDPRYVLKKAHRWDTSLMWDRSVNFSCLIRIMRVSRQQKVMSAQGILIWDRSILGKMPDETWCLRWKIWDLRLKLRIMKWHRHSMRLISVMMRH